MHDCRPINGSFQSPIVAGEMKVMGRPTASRYRRCRYQQRHSFAHPAKTPTYSLSVDCKRRQHFFSAGSSPSWVPRRRRQILGACRPVRSFTTALHRTGLTLQHVHTVYVDDDLSPQQTTSGILGAPDNVLKRLHCPHTLTDAVCAQTFSNSTHRRLAKHPRVAAAATAK